MSWVNDKSQLGVLTEQISTQIVLKEEGMFTAEPFVVAQRATLLLNEFMGDGHKLDSFETVWACFAAFERWYNEPEFSFEFADFQFSIERKIGQDTYRLGMSVRSPAETKEQREHAYWLLEREIENHFNAIFVRLGAAIVAPAGAAPAQVQNEVETIAYDRVSHTVETNGQHRIRMFGGRWQKFGVAVYPEILQKVGWKPETLPFGETPMFGNMQVELRGGKPVRVISIEPLS